MTGPAGAEMTMVYGEKLKAGYLGWQAAVLVGTMLYLLFAGVRVAFVLSLLGVLGL